MFIKQYVQENAPLQGINITFSKYNRYNISAIYGSFSIININNSREIYVTYIVCRTPVPQNTPIVLVWCHSEKNKFMLLNHTLTLSVAAVPNFHDYFLCCASYARNLVFLSKTSPSFLVCRPQWSVIEVYKWILLEYIRLYIILKYYRAINNGYNMVFFWYSIM